MSTANPLVIFGIGTLGRLACAYFEQEAERNVVAFVVDDEFLPEGRIFLGRPVLGSSDFERDFPPESCEVFVAIGFSECNQARASVFSRLSDHGYELPTFVSRLAYVAPGVSLGKNCLILEHSSLQSGVQIGNDVIVWSGSCIAHDTVVEDHCFLATHASISGNSRVGAGTFVGANATVRDGVSIGEQAVIGAGAVILRNVDPGAVHSVQHTAERPIKSWELQGI